MLHNIKKTAIKHIEYCLLLEMSARNDEQNHKNASGWKESLKTTYTRPCLQHLTLDQFSQGPILSMKSAIKNPLIPYHPCPLLSQTLLEISEEHSQ